jgi:hypothetical protein
VNALTGDYIVIDTCVFVHMFNDQENHEQHIDSVLKALVADGIRLCVDDRDTVAKEYDQQVGPLLVQDDRGLRVQWLRYLLDPGEWKRTIVDRRGELLKKIEAVIREQKEKVDRVLVAIACTEGRILVTNDKQHILIGPERERRQGPRRARLLRATRKCRKEGADLIDSKEAQGRLEATEASL